MSQLDVKLFNWNVRGLNSHAKKDCVRSRVYEAGSTIVCLQESKLQFVDSTIISHAIGPRFANNFAFLPADGTRGGIILACDDIFFTLPDVLLGSYSLSAKITMLAEGLQWSITVVYGPQPESEKISFLDEISSLKPSMLSTWFLVGDFNLIYKAFDKNNDRLNRGLMQRFKGLLDRLELKELPLPGRRFTWANTGPNPTQTKIDRAFCTTDWDLLFFAARLFPLSSSSSDHAPLFLLGCDPPQRSVSFRFESYWLEIPGFLDVVKNSWERHLLASNPFSVLRLKLCRLARDLKRWSKSQVGDIRLQFAIANEVIFQLEVAQESRLLSDEERSLIAELKVKVLGLAVLNKIRIKQRSRLTWLKVGDVNSKFFHLKANYRRRKNYIQSLTTPDGIATSTADKHAELHRFFSARFGLNQPRDLGLIWKNINFPSFDLSELEADISEEELKATINCLPPEKAPGPDGFTGSFFKVAWDIIKGDLLAAVIWFWNLNTSNFQDLNSALITLLPKKGDASSADHYRPISLMHSFAKIITKTLANRLAPRLNELVSHNQSAFVRKRAIHDNFLFVQNMVKSLHRQKKKCLFVKVDISKAFDSVSWPFLLEVLQRLGFGTKWCNWVSNLLASSSSKILLNGSPGEEIIHFRGLRQGDPLSPLLFILVMEPLQRLICKAEDLSLLTPVSGRLSRFRCSLYADDVAIFVKPTKQDIDMLC